MTDRTVHGEQGVARPTGSGSLPAALERAWYRGGSLSTLLLPLSWLVCRIATLRRWLYGRGILGVRRFPVPVIVVGNLTVGGTGKTPLVIWLAHFLLAAGYQPGVVSRGYGGRARSYPQQVRPDSDPGVVGDEALLISRNTGCPMAVGPDRPAAVAALLAHNRCDVVISDDGLQHYRLARDVEIAVIDGTRRLGNRRCLPAGPLREPARRLEEVDLVVTSGGALQGEFPMTYRGETLVPLAGGAPLRIGAFMSREVHAVAGVGNPGRFFQALRDRGIRVMEHPFPDHHRYLAADLDFGDSRPVLMTEKDAVKCERFAVDNQWYLPVDAELAPAFGQRLLQLLNRIDGAQRGSTRTCSDREAGNGQ